MFLRITGVLIFSCSFVFVRPSLAQNEAERRADFYRHEKRQKEYDLERKKGLPDFLKAQAEWEEQRKQDIKDHQKRKKAESPVEGGPEYKADRREKLKEYEEYLEAQKAYLKEKKSHEAKNASEQAKRDAWALEEYGLDQERPRFDVTKRNYNGGKGTSLGGSSPRGNMNFPPPPVFNDFGEGYIPPPPMDDFDAPPPPEAFPMPPPPFPPPPDGDFDNGFYPPPPPPPMPMPDSDFDDGM